jgi:hypothetical protein
MTKFENKSFSVGGYHPTPKGTKCEACVFGRGEHSPDCTGTGIKYTDDYLQSIAHTSSKILALNADLIADPLLKDYLLFMQSAYKLVTDMILLKKESEPPATEVSRQSDMRQT